MKALVGGEAFTQYCDVKIEELYYLLMTCAANIKYAYVRTHTQAFPRKCVVLRVGVNDLFCGKNYVWPPAAAGKKLGHNQHQPGSQLETRRRDVSETGAKNLQNGI